MAGRSSRNYAILFKPETTYGTDAAPTFLADAVLMAGDVTLDVEHLSADRQITSGFFRATDKIIWTRRGKASFSVEMAGSGTAGTAPQWGDILLGCAFAETVTAGARVEYTPVSSGLKSGTIWAQKDGLLYKFVGSMGNIKGSVKVGEVPTFTFDFQGLITAAPAAAANSTPTLTSWLRPQAASPATTAKIKLGGTYSAGALSGGTDIDVREMTFDLGNDVQALALATSEAISIYDRNPTGKIVLDLTATQEASYLASVFAGTTTSVGLLHGTGAGKQVGLYAPNATIGNMGTDKQGTILLSTMDLVFQPVSGNDEIRIFTL